MNTTYIKLILLLLFIISTSIIPGCIKSSIITPYYTISEEFANYCWFEEGSWWIFQNDSTMQTDSIKITDVFETKRFHSQHVSFHYDAIELFIKSNIFNISRHELTAGEYGTTLGEMTSLLRLYKDDGSYQLVFSPKYPIGATIILGDKSGNYTNVELIESLELNGSTYIDVYHTRVLISVDADIEYNYWIAKNYSLIKYISRINGQTTSISLTSSNLIAHQNRAN